MQSQYTKEVSFLYNTFIKYSIKFHRTYNTENFILTSKYNVLTRRRFSRYYLKMISENQRERYAMFSQNTFEILFFRFCFVLVSKMLHGICRVHIRDGMRITVCNTFLFLMISETYEMLMCTVNKIGEIRFRHVG